MSVFYYRKSVLVYAFVLSLIDSQLNIFNW